MATKNAVDQATIDKAVAAQKVADEKAQDKEQAKSDATANPSVSLVAEGATVTRMAGEVTTLDRGHSYDDRIRAQARDLGIPIEDSMTAEWVAFLIRNKASA